MITGNEPAFPSDHEWSEGGKDLLGAPVIVHRKSFGLSKREYYAGLAIQGLLSNTDTLSDTQIVFFAEKAVKAADALMAELNQPNK